MKMPKTVLCLAAIFAFPPGGSAASPTKEDIQRLREFYSRELTKCYSLPKPQYEACEARVTEQGRQILNSSKQTKSATATLLYRCNIPALAPATITSSFSIWRLAADQLAWKSSKTSHFAVPASNETHLFPIQTFGNPAKGNASYTFQSGVSISIAPNGWATTSLDQVHNKNSLYGEVSPKSNARSGNCQRANGGVTRTFSVSD